MQVPARSCRRVLVVARSRCVPSGRVGNPRLLTLRMRNAAVGAGRVAFVLVPPEVHNPPASKPSDACACFKPVTKPRASARPCPRGRTLTVNCASPLQREKQESKRAEQELEGRLMGPDRRPERRLRRGPPDARAPRDRPRSAFRRRPPFRIMRHIGLSRCRRSDRAPARKRHIKASVRDSGGRVWGRAQLARRASSRDPVRQGAVCSGTLKVPFAPAVLSAFPGDSTFSMVAPIPPEIVLPLSVAIVNPPASA